MKKDETKSVHESTLNGERFKKLNEDTLSTLVKLSSAHLLSKESSASFVLSEDEFKQNVEMVINPLIQDYKNLTGFNVEIVYSNYIYHSLENLVGLVIGEFTVESEFTIKIIELSISYPMYLHLVNSYAVDSATKALNNTLETIERSFKEASFYFKTNRDSIILDND